MKSSIRSLFIISTILTLCSACGGGGAGGGGTTGSGGEEGGTQEIQTGTEPGVASINSLSTIPTIDLSSYDGSANVSASIAALVASVEPGLGKDVLADSLKAAGMNSRGGCEAKMLKREIIRQSQMLEDVVCNVRAPERLAAASELPEVFLIPTGEYAYYNFIPPDVDDGEAANLCGQIDADEQTDVRAACEAGGAESGRMAGMSMKVRVGIIDDALQLDVLKGDAGAEVRTLEATFTADGSEYTGTMIHAGKFGGKEESSFFSTRLNLGTDGTVDEGSVNLGTNGSVHAENQTSGPYGSGVIIFDAASQGLNDQGSPEIKTTIASAFNSSMTKSSGASCSHVSKVYAVFDSASSTGCAKYSYVGQCAMPAAALVPWDVDDKVNFLGALGMKLGIMISDSNVGNVKLCENPNYTEGSAGVKPMIPIGGPVIECPEVTKGGTECFSITNVAETTSYGTDVRQSFTLIDTADAVNFAEVDSFDLDTLDETVSIPDFSRTFDGTGEFQVIDESTLSDEERQTLKAAMETCVSTEEKAFRNRGMGEHNCNEQQQQNGVSEFAKDPKSIGLYAGVLSYKSNPASPPGSLCSSELHPAYNVIAIDTVDKDRNIYCITNPVTGTCHRIDISTAKDGKGNDVKRGTPEGGKLSFGTQMENINLLTFGFSGEVITGAVVRFAPTGGDNCNRVYAMRKPSFTAPPEFGSQDKPPPTACVMRDAAGNLLTNPDGSYRFIPEADCKQLCHDKPSMCK